MIYALEAMYSFVRKIQLSSEAGFPRVFPLFPILVILTPAVDCAIRLALSLPDVRSFGNYGLWGSVDGQYYLSIGLSAMAGYIWLDRRRHEIDAKFRHMTIPKTMGMRLVIVFGIMSIGTLEVFLSSKSRLGVVIMTALILLLASRLLKICGLRGRWGSGPAMH